MRSPSFYDRHGSREKRNGKIHPHIRLRLAALSLIVLVISASIAIGFAVKLVDISDESALARSSTIDTIPMTLICQHKDTNMACTVVGCVPPGAHAWNDAAGADGIYGNMDDCPHCSAYCAPGAIAMIALAYGMPPPFTQQDDIYDAGKSTPPEIPGNGIIETHGVGMFDGTGGRPLEVQAALGWALQGMPVVQHDFWGTGNLPLDPVTLQNYIRNLQPVLWLDHGRWPVNQSSLYPPSDDRAEQGHAKVIAGYDDNDTAEFSDDLVLIYDPWPEYNDTMVLPKNATKGPGGSFNPYWLPLNDVNLTDASDLFLVPTLSIPEFGTLILPVMACLLIAIVAMQQSTRRRR